MAPPTARVHFTQPNDLLPGWKMIRDGQERMFVHHESKSCVSSFREMFDLQKQIDYQKQSVASVSPTFKKAKLTEFENMSVNENDDDSSDNISELGMNGMSQQES